MNVTNTIAPTAIGDYLSQLLPSEKRYLERIHNRTARWKPQSVPQWQAFLSRADELFYGGAGGGGKSDLLLGLAGEAHEKSIIFRRVFPNLRELIERSRQLYGSPDNDHRKDSFNESLHVWRFEYERMLEFAAMQYEKDKKNFQGRRMTWSASTRPRNLPRARSFCDGVESLGESDQRVRVILTGNPPMDEDGMWIVRRYAAWLKKDHHHPAKSGELRWYAVLDGKEQEVENGALITHKSEIIYPRSRTFIRAFLDVTTRSTQTMEVATNRFAVAAG
jgi:hypothetical protein